VDEKTHLIRFIEKTDAFDNNSKLKALLFATGAKPSTYVHFRIQKNLHDKHEFERLLKLNKIPFETSRAKGYEELSKVTGNKAVWRLQGTWHGYDLFKNKKEQHEFHKYVGLIKKQKHHQADKLAGKIYGYPDCCTKEFIEGHDIKKLAKKYTYYQYYKKLHDSDTAFPFIAHTPCSPKCAETKKLNKKYQSAIKKYAPSFYKKYLRKRIYNIPVIVDVESDFGIWKKKDGHDYVLVTLKPLEGRNLLISWLTKAKFERGTKLLAEITLQYDYATVKIKKKTGHVKNFHHERKFSTP
jgi:hypothetical protein